MRVTNGVGGRLPDDVYEQSAYCVILRQLAGNLKRNPYKRKRLDD